MTIESCKDFIQACSKLISSVEAYYRKQKLSKPIWANITPVIVKYMVYQAMLHVIFKYAPTQAKKSLEATENDTTVDTSLVNLQDTFIRNNQMYQEYYNKLDCFWKTIPPRVQVCIRQNIIKSINEPSVSNDNDEQEKSDTIDDEKNSIDILQNLGLNVAELSQFDESQLSLFENKKSPLKIENACVFNAIISDNDRTETEVIFDQAAKLEDVVEYYQQKPIKLSPTPLKSFDEFMNKFESEVI